MTSHRPLRHYRRYPRRSRTPRTAHSEAAFTLPDIPPLLVTSEARASYLAAHYWQGFNFRDTALISRPEVTEQALADFLDILSRVPLAEAQSSLTAMMDSQLAFPQRGVLHPCAAPRHCFAPSGRTGQGTR